jgi:hypothetical protein
MTETKHFGTVLLVVVLTGCGPSSPLPPAARQSRASISTGDDDTDAHGGGGRVLIDLDSCTLTLCSEKASEISSDVGRACDGACTSTDECGVSCGSTAMDSDSNSISANHGPLGPDDDQQAKGGAGRLFIPMDCSPTPCSEKASSIANSSGRFCDGECRSENSCMVSCSRSQGAQPATDR